MEMKIKTIQDFDVREKRVLLRVDFNVDIDEKGRIIDDYKVVKTIPTIKYLLERQAKIILMSHLGRPEKGLKNRFTLKPIAKRLEELLNKKVRFLPDCVGERIEKITRSMKPGEIILLENLRFHEEEMKGDLSFAKRLASLGEIYINDAFGCVHRDHASISKICQFLPSGGGFLLEEEINTLSQAVKKKVPPLVAVIGGVKIKTKIGLVDSLLKEADEVIVGGKIAYDILAGKGLCMRGYIPEPEVLEVLDRIEITNPKLHLPVDGVVVLKEEIEGYCRKAALGQIRKEEKILDIGPETVRIFREVIFTAKTIIWNGPLGKFEDERFARGSLEIADAIIKSRAFSIIGGGDTCAFLRKYHLTDKFGFISTGGGAMLSFLENKRLPGLLALEKSNN